MEAKKKKGRYQKKKLQIKYHQRIFFSVKSHNQGLKFRVQGSRSVSECLSLCVSAYVLRLHLRIWEDDLIARTLPQVEEEEEKIRLGQQPIARRIAYFGENLRNVVELSRQRWRTRSFTIIQGCCCCCWLEVWIAHVVGPTTVHWVIRIISVVTVVNVRTRLKR